MRSISSTAPTAAVSFTTGPAPSTLQSVSVRAYTQDSSGTTFAASLCADDGGAPGTPLATFPATFYNEQTPLLTFASAGTPLAPDTTYWLRMDTTPRFAYWGTTLQTTEASDYGWTIGNSTWPYVIPASIGRLSIDAAVLPEPAALSLTALTALAALAAPLLARRRRRI